MKPGQKIECYHCKGSGQVSIPGFKDGEPVTKKKECAKCRGTGVLVLTLDKRYQRKPGEVLIMPPGGIIRPNLNLN